MRRRTIAICLTIAAATLLAAVPAASAASEQRAKASTPSIVRVLPMRIKVGEQLTISGRNFNPVKAKNTVIFRAPSGRTAFAKPSKAQRHKLVVTVPRAVSHLLAQSSGSTRPTRFKLRVLSGTFSSFTSRRLSPVIVGSGGRGDDDDPKGGKDTGGGSKDVGSVAPAPPAPPTCDSSADHDGDLLTNALELQIGTDPCLRDTDVDGVEDGYEYRSAVDLNDDEFQDPNTALPYPGKRPYPNPLDDSDAQLDFDGDVLTLTEEQRLWRYTIANGAARTLTPLTYSDGKQYSVDVVGSDNRRSPALPAAGYPKQVGFLAWALAAGYRTVLLENEPQWGFPGSAQELYGLLDFDRLGGEHPVLERYYYDFDHDDFLSDDERDEDGDGATNYDESHGRLTPEYWTGCYASEKAHPVGYAGTDIIDADSDGDGVLDGADDQDHDDIPNVMELSRFAASARDDAERLCKPLQGLPSPPSTNHPNVYGRMNPFNPCLPAVSSRTCTRHPGIGGDGAPFDDSLDWASLN